MKTNLKKSLLALWVAFMIGLTACGSTSQAEPPSTSVEPITQSQTETAETTASDQTVPTDSSSSYSTDISDLPVYSGESHEDGTNTTASSASNNTSSSSTQTTTAPAVVAETNQATAQQDTSSPTSSSSTFILNTNSKKFHLPSCSSIKRMKDSNKKEFSGSRDEVIAQGYEPCKKCNP